MKFPRLNWNRAQKSAQRNWDAEPEPGREPEGHIHPNFRHWSWFHPRSFD